MNAHQRKKDKRRTLRLVNKMLEITEDLVKDLASGKLSFDDAKSQIEEARRELKEIK